MSRSCRWLARRWSSLAVRSEGESALDGGGGVLSAAERDGGGEGREVTIAAISNWRQNRDCVAS